MRPSTPLLQSTPILLRDFIWHSLYHPTQGYFANQAPVVGFLEPPINFSALAGRRAYLEEVQRRYAQLQVSWLTPVEIFSPHVGATLARYMLEQALQQPSFASNSWSFASSMENNLRIYEIGGGTGTLALDVLSWLRHHHPRAYSQCHYTSLEISPSLAQLQKNRLRAAGHDEQRFRVQLGDAASPSTWVGPSEEPCFILAMEVLDNLPHDRCVNTKSGIADGSVWHETVISTVFEDTNVQRSDAAVYKEGLMPVRDPLIARCLDGYVDLYEASELKVASFRSIGSLVGNAVRRLVDASLQLEKTIFLPTGAMRLFDTLHAMRPSHTLICADFDNLPETRIHGWNAPLVATTVRIFFFYIGYFRRL